MATKEPTLRTEKIINEHKWNSLIPNIRGQTVYFLQCWKRKEREDNAFKNTGHALLT